MMGKENLIDRLLANIESTHNIGASGMTMELSLSDAYVIADALERKEKSEQSKDKNNEPEAHKLARILLGIIEAAEDYSVGDLYRDGYQSIDGDVFVHRAAHLLIEQQADIQELTRYVDSLGSQLAKMKSQE